VSSDSGLLQGGRRLLLQEGACGSGTAACSNRLLLGFLGVLDEGVEFDFEGGGSGDDVSWCGTHAGAEGETLATAWRRPVTAAASVLVSPAWVSAGGDVDVGR
jgi:hypothetical protein